MASASSPIIRAASPDDSIAMAEVVRAAASPLMRETTILGGAGLDRFIRDQIASASANRFLVAEVGGHIVGMSAWRYEGEELFLNHLFVHPSVQGRRVGTWLWARGLAGLNTGAARTLSLDVYEDNTRAAAWYRSLGLEPVAQRIVMAVPIPSVSPTADQAWSSTFLGPADHDYSQYGFSQFALSTQRAAYTIGRLGTDFFRITSSALLDDEAALAALHRLDSRRRLLCFDAPDRWEAIAGRGAVVLGRTIRLTIPVEQLAARFTKTLPEAGR